MVTIIKDLSSISPHNNDGAVRKQHSKPCFKLVNIEGNRSDLAPWTIRDMTTTSRDIQGTFSPIRKVIDIKSQTGYKMNVNDTLAAKKGKESKKVQIMEKTLDKKSNTNVLPTSLLAEMSPKRITKADYENYKANRSRTAITDINKDSSSLNTSKYMGETDSISISKILEQEWTRKRDTGDYQVQVVSNRATRFKRDIIHSVPRHKSMSIPISYESKSPRMAKNKIPLFENSLVSTTPRDCSPSPRLMLEGEKTAAFRTEKDTKKDDEEKVLSNHIHTLFIPAKIRKHIFSEREGASSNPPFKAGSILSQAIYSPKSSFSRSPINTDHLRLRDTANFSDVINKQTKMLDLRDERSPTNTSKYNPIPCSFVRTTRLNDGATARRTFLGISNWEIKDDYHSAKMTQVLKDNTPTLAPYKNSDHQLQNNEEQAGVPSPLEISQETYHSYIQSRLKRLKGEEDTPLNIQVKHLQKHPPLHPQSPEVKISKWAEARSENNHIKAIVSETRHHQRAKSEIPHTQLNPAQDAITSMAPKMRVHKAPSKEPNSPNMTPSSHKPSVGSEKRQLPPLNYHLVSKTNIVLLDANLPEYSAIKSSLNESKNSWLKK